MIDFATFFGELHRSSDGPPLVPHDWQVRLAERLATGEPPRVVAVPTGGGKTATVDALVWALAAQAERAPHERTIGVRTVWAIDRRILVDEVHQRVEGIAARLARAAHDRGDVLHGIAAALTGYTDGFGPALLATRWRGQVRIEPRAHHPFQPEVITSTVAQVGSRLLFRGFGVGERSLAVEAALAGVDCTICLDEAHLVEPFRQTVDAVRAARKSQEPAATFGPLTLMTLTATPSRDAEPAMVHSLTEADEDSLRDRLDAEKIATLVESADERDEDQVAALLAAVEAHLDAGAHRVACVVNTVQIATLIAARAERAGRELDVAVLVGPQRPVDRARLLQDHRGAVFERLAPERPLLVVATQTIEVGLDADFEALVTQSASATALVQRFGRLNRAGLDRGRATVVRQRGVALYERDEERCWEWLKSRRREDGTIDVSPRALATDGGPPPDARMPDAPLLTDETIELLQQTAPRPAALSDPAVEPFLRGVDEPPSGDVQVCWRADLRLAAHDPESSAYRSALLRLAPPRSEELVTIGLRRLHALLGARFGDQRRRAAMVRSARAESDVEGGGEPHTGGDEVHSDRPARFVVVRDADTLEVGLPGSRTHQRDVRPGDVVVLGTEAGGYSADALAPASDAPVADVGNRVALTMERDRPVGLRLTHELVGSAAVAFRLAGRHADAATDAKEISTADREALLAPLGLDIALDAGATFDVLRVAGAEWEPADDGWDDEIDDDPLPADGALLDDELDHAGVEAFVLVLHADRRPDLVRRRTRTVPALEEHAAAVTARAETFAAFLRPSLAHAVSAAARAHDHGKADDRIQAFFRGGTRGIGDELIAKSVFGTDDRRAVRRARSDSGLPSRLRHEMASVAILAEHLARERPMDGWPFDESLALHLVGTHHGLARPWPEVPGGGVPSRDFAVSVGGVNGAAHGDGSDGWEDGAWLRSFFATCERYGAWGTAYLEALLVLADRTISAEGG